MNRPPPLPFLRPPKRVKPETVPDSPPPPVYDGSVRLLDWKNTARGGMTVDLGIRDTGPSDPHPFKGLRCGRDGGQRLRAWVGPHHDAYAEGAAPSPHYEGEAVLMRWSDDSVAGMSVRLAIDDGPDGTAGKHPFEGFATGRKEGEGMHLVAWLLADDERLEHPSRVRRRTPFYELSETRQSQILCRDARFASFLALREEAGDFLRCSTRPEADPAGFAAEALKKWLGIDSRAVLGHDTAEGALARRKWAGILRSYFGAGR